MTLSQQFSEPWAAGPDDPYRIDPCEECGAEDRDFGQHEPGCPSGFPTREATEFQSAVREFEDEQRVGPF